jgi:predicted acylesterase/phospholipase RssA
VQPSEQPIIVLFTYGGGLRGLIPAQIMARIESDTDLRISDMVDVFAGPSTGAILNAALTLRHEDDRGRPKYRARHLVRFYEREGERIFPPDRFREFRGLIHDFNNRTMRISQLNSLFKHGHYNPANLGRSLRALYGDAKLSHSLRSLIIPTYNIDGEQLYAVTEAGETPLSPVHTKNNFMDTGGHAVWLKNIRINKGLIPSPPIPEVSLFDAVMASTAAPSYFPCHHFGARWAGDTKQHEYTGIDGGIFDNPAVTYLGALRRHLLPEQKIVMIGLGTGYTNKSIKKDDWNRYGALGIVDPVNDLPLINIFFHACESALLDSFKDDMEDNLFLFNKSLVSSKRDNTYPSLQIDDGSPENMKKLKDFADGIIEENRAQYEQVCNILVRNYEYWQQRGKTERPSRWKKIFSYMTN